MVAAGQKVKLWAEISQIAHSVYKQQNNWKNGQYENVKL